jgi:serine/threonine protein phosphatase PrpC
MNDNTKTYFTDLFGRNIDLNNDKQQLWEAFIREESNAADFQKITAIKNMLTDKWRLKNRVDDILNLPVTLPNATVGKPYEAALDMVRLNLDDIVRLEWHGLEALGLSFNRTREIIDGVPTHAGDHKIELAFGISGEAEDSVLHRKTVVLVVNPNPKSLWKNLPSNVDAPFWKPDNFAHFGQLGDKNIVAASKRGRSHANEGSFRDDDFLYRFFEQNGWSVIAAADGAGSAKYARRGSELACKAVIDHFEAQFSGPEFDGFDALLADFNREGGEENQRKLSQFVYKTISQAALAAHNRLVKLSETTEGTALKDFHTTLIFTLFKKYEFGYALLSFGVGDCPIALIGKDGNDVTLLNRLDVGEFGGGTRFITMPEIFKADTFSNRIKFKLTEDFSFLFMMTDGIYDPKFVVEANLEKIECWQTFIKDLQGDNPDHNTVRFERENEKIAGELSSWLDFWSTGNHDDRTLIVVF